MNAIKTLFKIIFKLIKWGAIGFIGLFIVALYMTNKESIEGAVTSLDEEAIMTGVLGVILIIMIPFSFKHIFRSFKESAAAIASIKLPSSGGYTAPANNAARRTAAPAPRRKSKVKISKQASRPSLKVERKAQVTYRLVYYNNSSVNKTQQRVNFNYYGGPTECRVALESGELTGQGFVASCCTIVSLTKLT